MSRFNLAALAISLMLPAALLVAEVGDTPDLITVTATGTGRDEAGALKQAFRNAVEQVVGTVLDSTSVVKNDDVIKDRILTYSNGFIERYDAVGKPKVANGLTSVSIRAEVKRTKLLEKVKASGISVAVIDGKSLAAKAETKRVQREAGGPSITEEFEDMPRALIKAEATGKLEYDEKMEMARLPIRLSVDMDAYAAFVTRLTRKLDDMGYVSRPLAVEPTNGTDRVRDQVSRERGGESGSRDRTVPAGLVAIEQDKPLIEIINFVKGVKLGDITLLLCTASNRGGDTTVWRHYTITAEMRDAIASKICPALLTIQLSDSDGHIIDSCETAIGQQSKLGVVGAPVSVFSAHPDAKGMDVIILPFLNAGSIAVGNSYRFRSPLLFLKPPGVRMAYSFSANFNISPDNLKKVAKSVCKIEAVPNSDSAKPRAATSSQSP